ncbi:MAG TPA: WYL domain-containing protein [Acidimicrobiales bacterium]|nr:WYL domain-containing protein [Acidimicrobiales bacterium]
MNVRLPAGARLRRLLAMLNWLSHRPDAKVDEIADRFSMSADEVVSELEMAACCGLPPYTPDRLIEVMVGEDRVEANLGAEFSRPVRFSAAEGFTVATAARAILAVPGSDPEGALARALAKLEEVLGERQRVSVDLDEPPLLGEVRRAADAGETLEIDYYSASRDEMTTRQVDPYAVFSTGGWWYLDGFCHRAGGVRHFRVDRIGAARPTGHRFDRPEHVEPGEVFEPGPDTPVAVLLLPESSRWVIESYPVVSVDDEPDGRLRVSLAVGGEAWLARLLLRAGPGSEVLEPAELRRCGAEAARRMLARYA